MYTVSYVQTAPPYFGLVFGKTSQGAQYIYIYIYIYNALQPDLCRVLYSVTQFDNTYIHI